MPCKHKHKAKKEKKHGVMQQAATGRANVLAFALKSVMHCCLLYLIASHAVLLAEGPAVLEPAQLWPRAASRCAAELDRVGGRNGVQLLLHLGRQGPVRSPCDSGGERRVGEHSPMSATQY